MHHTMMNYQFKQGCAEEGFARWKSSVADIISKQPGFVRVQFYINADGHALAIGSWQNIADSEVFMKTGIFRDLMASFGDLLDKQPTGGHYQLRYFEEK